MTRSLLRTTAAAFATAALLAPAAVARPDAAPPARQAATVALHKGLHRAHGDGFATRPVLDRNPVQADRPAPAPATVSVVSADHGISWVTIGIGIAGSLLAVGAVAFITDRTRRPRAGISA